MKISQILTLVFAMLIIGYHQTAEKKITSEHKKEKAQQERILQV